MTVPIFCGDFLFAGDPCISDSNMPSGSQTRISWDVNLPSTLAYGRYTSTIHVSSNETADCNIPVIALVRTASDSVQYYEGADPNLATQQKKMVLDANGHGRTWVHIPQGYFVVYATLGVSSLSADLENPQIDIGDNGTIEWRFSGKLDKSTVVDDVEKGFNEYLAYRVIGPNGVDVPIAVNGKPNETIMLNGISVYLDNIATDFEPDGDVDSMDFAVLASQWLRNDCNELNGWCEKADLDFDGKVNAQELKMFSKSWLWNIKSYLNYTGLIHTITLSTFAQHWLDNNCSILTNYCDYTDFDGNGKVDLRDYALFAQNWFDSPTP